MYELTQFVHFSGQNIIFEFSTAAHIFYGVGCFPSQQFFSLGGICPESGKISFTPRPTYIARVAAGVLPELTIFGGDYPTPDGTCQRDYLHVVDLAVGHLKALEYAENHTGVEAIVLNCSFVFSASGTVDSPVSTSSRSSWPSSSF